MIIETEGRDENLGTGFEGGQPVTREELLDMDGGFTVRPMPADTATDLVGQMSPEIYTFDQRQNEARGRANRR